MLGGGWILGGMGGGGQGGRGGGWRGLRGRGEGYGMEEGLGSWSLCLCRVGLQLREVFCEVAVPGVKQCFQACSSRITAKQSSCAIPLSLSRAMDSFSGNRLGV